MKWFVFELIRDNVPNRLCYVNARTLKSATNRLDKWNNEQKVLGQFKSFNEGKPLEFLIACWHYFGQDGIVVAP